MNSARSVFAAAFLSLLVAAPAGAETRGYVISLIHTATFVDDSTCPNGTNGSRIEILTRRLLAAGYSDEEAFRIIDNGGVDDDGNRIEEASPLGGSPTASGKQTWKGHDVNPGNVPWLLPDPEIELAQGRYAAGFNLDGKTGRNAWEHPETGEHGIDNQMWRVLGCWDAYYLNKPVRPYNESIVWDTAIDAMPAWLMSVSGENLDDDGNVTVVFDRAINVLIRDAFGGVMSGATFAVDTDPRSHSEFRGRITDRVLTIEPGEFFMQGESQFYPHLRFMDTQLRLVIDEDGSMRGTIGGYQPWQDYYHYLAVRGELDGQVDLPGAYYAMKRLADAYPDPVSGENTAISAAYFLEAVPAFHTDTTGRLVAMAVGPGPKFSGPAVSQSVADE